ncbi:MAG: lysophospholipid acyltransferase family protein [Myxococcales bacterium]
MIRAATLLHSVLHLFLLVLLSVVGAVLSLVSAPFDRSGDTVVTLARLWSRMLLWTAGVKLTVKMHAPLDPRQPYVFMANHLSTVDIWAVFVAIPSKVRFIAKKQLSRIPLFGWAMAAGRFIFIDRQNPLAARRSIGEAAQRIRAGSSVAIFPEGTRSRDGRLGPFKKGGFHLAISAGVPIVPVGIRGAHEVMPRGSLILRRGPVTIEVGAPIPTAGLSLADRTALLERVRGEVARMSGQAKRTDAVSK